MLFVSEKEQKTFLNFCVVKQNVQLVKLMKHRKHLDVEKGWLLKSDSHLPKKFVYLLSESPLKFMKNAFYLILKALFVLKVFKFLS